MNLLEKAISLDLTAVQAVAILKIHERELNDQLPPNMSTIAEWCSTTTAAATGMVDRMIKRGLLSRKYSQEDRRMIRIELTAIGSLTANELK